MNDELKHGPEIIIKKNKKVCWSKLSLGSKISYIFDYINTLNLKGIITDNEIIKLKYLLINVVVDGKLNTNKDVIYDNREQKIKLICKLFKENDKFIIKDHNNENSIFYIKE